MDRKGRNWKERNSLAKHVWLYSDLFQALKGDSVMALGSQQRKSIFCIRNNPPPPPGEWDGGGLRKRGKGGEGEGNWGESGGGRREIIGRRRRSDKSCAE